MIFAILPHDHHRACFKSIPVKCCSHYHLYASMALKGVEIGLFGGISVDADDQIQLPAMIPNMLWLTVSFI